jgi:hypothetical protein
MPMRTGWIAVVVVWALLDGGLQAADAPLQQGSYATAEASPTPPPAESGDTAISRIAQLVPSFDNGQEGDSGRGRSGFLAYAEFLNWQPHSLNTNFATVADPVTLTPSSTQSLDMDRTNGFRLGLGYRFADSDCDLTWNFTSFFGHGEATLTSNGGAVGLLDPNSVYTNMAMDSIEAIDTFQLNVHDIELNWRNPLNDTVGFRATAAFRYAHLDEDFVNNYVYLANTTGSVNMPITMDAEGFRLGAEFQWQSPWGFRLFGRTAESILIGSFRSERQESDSLHGPLADVVEDSTKIVPVVEVAAGATWSQGPLAISVGYELSDWFNLAGIVPVQPAPVPGKTVAPVASQAQSLFLEGCFVRLIYSR